MQTNEIQEYNRGYLLCITNEHVTTCRLDGKVFTIAHSMTINSIAQSQAMLRDTLVRHGAVDTVFAFRPDIDDCLDIGGKTKVRIEGDKTIELDGVTAWLLYVRGYIVYSFDRCRWEVKELKAHSLGGELVAISKMLEATAIRH